MSNFLDGIGLALGKISQQFQSRIERLKNEKRKLNEEKELIVSKRSPLYARDLDRVLAIDKRVAEIKSILENNAKD